MNRLLQALGLMRVSEHERAVTDRVSIAIHNDVVAAFKEQLADKDANFKKAITDLAAAREEIAGLNRRLTVRSDGLSVLRKNIADLHAEINKLTPDALAMRRKRERDRNRRKGKVS